ncbi:MAG TPA: response regulator [Terriglobia bacterium]|nr:response regulator [Terriglobia bacterium]
MRQKIRAVLVRNSPSDLAALRSILQQLIKVTDARSCEEAGRHLRVPDPPHLVFTSTALSDGTWLEVLALAREAPKPVNVVVMARDAEVGLYVTAMEAGAFDFVTASATVPELAHVLRNAAENVLHRRGAGKSLGPDRAPGPGKRKPLWWSRSA